MKKSGSLKRGKGPKRTANLKTFRDQLIARERAIFKGMVRNAEAYLTKTPRKPLRKKGARAKRDVGALKNFREVALARAAGICERCETRPRGPLEAHHMVNRARAAGWPSLHDPHVNALCACFACHRFLDIFPRDEGGPVENRAAVAFRAFEEWRARTASRSPGRGQP